MSTIAAWVLALAAGWLGLRWFERFNLYFPLRTIEGTPDGHGMAYQDLWLEASDGARLHSWLVAGEPDGPVVLFCHGNGGNISHRMEKLRILKDLGASVLIFDYRGYGRSSGSPSEEGTYRDAEAASEGLAARPGLASKPIYYFGESLGAAVALELALRRPPAGLILESAFTSVPDMGRRLYPFLPVDRIARFRYDNAPKIARLRAPLLVMHSPQDDIVPFAMGRALFDAAPQPKTFFELKGDHNGGFLATGPSYGGAIKAFLVAPDAAPP